MSCNSRSYKSQKRKEKIENSNFETIERKESTRLSILESEILTVKDLAYVLESSRAAVYEMIKSGRLQASNLSSRMTRVKRDDFWAFFHNSDNTRKVLHKKVVEKIEERPLTKDNCYTITELVNLFEKDRLYLYTFLKRSKISKVKVGKEVFFSRFEIDKLYIKFKGPKIVGYDKEREANIRLAKRGLKRSECYTMEECEALFNDKRENLYSKFSRRKVPKIQNGKTVLYAKRAVDRIFKGIKRGEDL